jgi:hypothetical protein
MQTTDVTRALDGLVQKQQDEGRNRSSSGSGGGGNEEAQAALAKLLGKVRASTGSSV